MLMQRVNWISQVVYISHDPLENNISTLSEAIGSLFRKHNGQRSSVLIQHIMANTL